MNTKKLILALTLCVIMVAVLFVYDGGLLTSFRQEDLYGSWVTDVPAAQRVEQSLAQFGITYDIADDLMMTYEFRYNEDGTVTVSVEGESAKELAAVQVEALREGLPEMLYEQYLTEANMDRAATDAMLAAQGLTMESLVEISLSQIDFEAQYTSASMSVTQHYCVKDGRVCYAASAVDLANGCYDMSVEAERKGDTLILSNAVDKDGNAFEGNGVVKYPLTLKRK